MDKKLPPTFILREYGVEVNDRPNINIEDPRIEDNVINTKGAGIRSTL